jgi:CheY-like chemotaxis protein
MNQETILVVDDNPEIASFLADDLLSSWGFRAVVAHDGKTALDSVREQPPDLILLDFQLSDVTGLDVLRQLAVEGSSVPTILITGEGSEQIAAKAFRLGVLDYFTKPVDADTLSTAITRALTESRLRREKTMLTNQLTQQVRSLTVLAQVGKSITSVLDLDEVLRRIVDAGVYLTQAEEGFLALLDDPGNQLYLRAVKNLEHKKSEISLTQVRDSLAGEVMSTGQPIRLSKNSPDAPLKVSTGYLVHSLLHVPVIAKGKTLGVLSVDNRLVERPFTDMDEMLMSSLADYAAAAIENARLYEQAQQEISDRKRAESALAAEQASLARRVEERTAALSAANAELARASRLKTEFVASISHELRTPLNAILGMSEGLQEEVFGQLNEQQKRWLRHIEESGRHLLALINDVLDLSKIEAGQMTLELRPVSVESVCQASLEIIGPDALKKRLEVISRFDEPALAVGADERRLKQILVNLLSNAVKFTPEGGKIGLEVTSNSERSLLEITVWDTGIGISEEDLNRLFKPFVQVDSSLSRQYGGTGLGLALVYRMVEMHGGSISIASEVDRGSRFTISLPWNSTGETLKPADPLPAANHTLDDFSKIRRALIIEDSPVAAEQFRRYLAEKGIESTIHSQGNKAAAVALDLQPDVIILDILLPSSSGWEVLALLKAEAGTQNIPVLIASVVDDRRRALALGAADHLVKPISRRQLWSALAALGDLEAAPGQADKQAAEGNGRERKIRSRGPLILLVEDHEQNIMTVSDYLSMKGYQVTVARNGLEALDRVTETKPDLILMDVQMPKMDGLEATRRLRSDPNLASIPIVALTALAMPGDRERCLAAGANDYLSKPISLRGLVEVIETQLN